jgi:hypothetical protein
MRRIAQLLLAVFLACLPAYGRAATRDAKERMAKKACLTGNA